MARHATALILTTAIAACTSFGSTTSGESEGGVDAAAGAADASDAGPPAVYALPCYAGRTCTELDFCCDPQMTGTPSCMPTCTGSGASYACHDAEDCRARGVGGVCCGYRESSNMVTTICRAKCLAGEEHLCDLRASSDECAAAGQACTRFTPDLNIGGFASCR